MKKLYLSQNDRKIAGVCGGIGEYFDVDPTLIRLAWILLTVISAIVPGVIGYLVAAVVIPNSPPTELPKKTGPKAISKTRAKSGSNTNSKNKK